jgi:hypothetical protein
LSLNNASKTDPHVNTLLSSTFLIEGVKKHTILNFILHLISCRWNKTSIRCSKCVGLEVQADKNECMFIPWQINADRRSESQARSVALRHSRSKKKLHQHPIFRVLMTERVNASETRLPAQHSRKVIFIYCTRVWTSKVLKHLSGRTHIWGGACFEFRPGLSVALLRTSK